MQPGPTGKFPFGKSCEEDGGEIAIMIAVNREAGTMLMNFGTVVEWISGPPEHAMQQIRLIRTIVKNSFGNVPYAVEGLPIKVVVRNGMIESHFPAPVSVLVGHPSTFLAWAQRLEEALPLDEEGMDHVDEI